MRIQRQVMDVAVPRELASQTAFGHIDLGADPGLDDRDSRAISSERPIGESGAAEPKQRRPPRMQEWAEVLRGMNQRAMAGWSREIVC